MLVTEHLIFVADVCLRFHPLHSWVCAVELPAITLSCSRRFSCWCFEAQFLTTAWRIRNAHLGRRAPHGSAIRLTGDRNDPSIQTLLYCFNNSYVADSFSKMQSCKVFTSSVWGLRNSNALLENENLTTNSYVSLFKLPLGVKMSQNQTCCRLLLCSAVHRKKHTQDYMWLILLS